MVGSLESKGRPRLGDMREESALNMFRQMDLRGKVKNDTQLKTVHQNTISTIRAYSASGGVVSKFSSKSAETSGEQDADFDISQRCRWTCCHLVCVAMCTLHNGSRGKLKKRAFYAVAVSQCCRREVEGARLTMLPDPSLHPPPIIYTTLL